MRAYFMALIDRVQATLPVNRLVALLTPVFVIVSGWLATFSIEHVPYLASIGFSDAQVLAVFIAGSTAGLAAAYKWLDGWQKHEARAQILGGVAVGGTPADHPTTPDIHPDDAIPDVGDLDSEKAKLGETTTTAREEQ